MLQTVRYCRISMYPVSRVAVICCHASYMCRTSLQKLYCEAWIALVKSGKSSAMVFLTWNSVSWRHERHSAMARLLQASPPLFLAHDAWWRLHWETGSKRISKWQDFSSHVTSLVLAFWLLFYGFSRGASIKVLSSHWEERRGAVTQCPLLWASRRWKVCR